MYVQMQDFGFGLFAQGLSSNFYGYLTEELEPHPAIRQDGKEAL